MRTLRLRDAHLARGASLGEAHGAEVATAYGDVTAEVLAARAGAVVADLSHRGCLRITGADRVSFLQGISSNDVALLSPGAGHYTTFLTGKGKMRGDAVVQAFGDHLRLTVEGDALAAIRAHLESFVILEDVKLEDVTSAAVVLGVHGPGSRAVLDGIGIAPPEGLGEHHFVTAAFAGGEVVVTAARPTGEDGFDIAVPPSAAAAFFTALAARARPAGFAALETLRVEAGIPRFGQDLDRDTIPIEGGLFHAIAYDKGCFTGQEVIARLKNYGHVNRNLCGILLEGKEAASVGAIVLAVGKPTGSVTSSVVSPHLGRPLALAMLRREVAVPGTEVTIESAGAVLPGLVAALPFVRRTG